MIKIADALKRSSLLCMNTRCRLFGTSAFYTSQAVEGYPARQAHQRLPQYPCRTRFAPSPTGNLHLGSLRTALFNYLLAKSTGGQFILRIEDTDQKRALPTAEERLYEDLRWAGLEWDEGPDLGGPHGPYRQSERIAMYNSHASNLVLTRHAYRCFCPIADTHTFESMPKRDCMSISLEESDQLDTAGASHVIRLRMPEDEPTYTDLIYGTVSQRSRRKSTRLERQCFHDLILIKSDGFPTYHLANVVDDHHMDITHVIRAAEWMSSTPKHMVIYQAFGWKPPHYAHVGLLQDSNHRKFSKRHGTTSMDVQSMEKQGVFPEALLNFVALHGWSHKLQDDFIRPNDLVRHFDFKFTKGNTVIVPTKLAYLQKRYAQYYTREQGDDFDALVRRIQVVLQDRMRHHEGDLLCPISELHRRIAAILFLDARNYISPTDFLDRNSYFFFKEDGLRNAPKHSLSSLNAALPQIIRYFEVIPEQDWTDSSIHQKIIQLGHSLAEASQIATMTDEEEDMSKGSLRRLQTLLRAAVSFGNSGPGIGQTMAILGRKVSLQRLNAVVAYSSATATNHPHGTGSDCP